MEWEVWVFWRVDARWTLSGGAACSSRPGDYDDDDDDDIYYDEVSVCLSRFSLNILPKQVGKLF